MVKKRQRKLEDYPALKLTVDNLDGVQRAVRKLRRKVKRRVGQTRRFF